MRLIKYSFLFSFKANKEIIFIPTRVIGKDRSRTISLLRGEGRVGNELETPRHPYESKRSRIVFRAGLQVRAWPAYIGIASFLNPI